MQYWAQVCVGTRACDQNRKLKISDFVFGNKKTFKSHSNYVHRKFQENIFEEKLVWLLTSIKIDIQTILAWAKILSCNSDCANFRWRNQY